MSGWCLLNCAAKANRVTTINKQIANAFQDLGSLAYSKAKELDAKHCLLKGATAAVTDSMKRIEMAFYAPQSSSGRHTIAAGGACFFVGGLVGGVQTGISFLFGSLFIDFEKGLAHDIYDAVADVWSAAWEKLEIIGTCSLCW